MNFLKQHLFGNFFCTRGVSAKDYRFAGHLILFLLQALYVLLQKFRFGSRLMESNISAPLAKLLDSIRLTWLSNSSIQSFMNLLNFFFQRRPQQILIFSCLIGNLAGQRQTCCSSYPSIAVLKPILMCIISNQIIFFSFSRLLCGTVT